MTPSRARAREGLLAAAGALASALAVAGHGRAEWPWLALGFVSLVPWLAALDRARSLASALGQGVLFALAFELFVFRWFADGIAAYAEAPRWVGLAAVLVLAPVLQPQLLVLAAVRHLILRAAPAAGLASRALASACVYVGAEWALPKLLADTLGHGLHGSALLRQGADLAGAAGLTFVLVVANECALAAARALAADGTGRARLLGAARPACVLVGLVLALSGYGALRLQQLGARAPGTPVAEVGIVQADISRYGRLRAELGSYEAARGILEAHFAYSAEALARGAVEILIWPETVYPTTFGSPKSEAGAELDRAIGAFVAETGVPLVFGAYDAEGADEFNAAVFLAPDATAPGRVGFETYRKAWLFPLTERVPAWLDSAWLRARLPWLGSWRPGEGARAVAVTLPGGRALRVAPLICYDTLAPDLARAAVRQGAELIVTLSNDSWFAVGAGPRLHLVLAAFRSIETRRPQVRATNTGISAVIDASGEVLGSLGVHERGILVAAVPAAGAPGSLVLALGSWLGPVAALAGAAALLGALASGRARRGPRAGGARAR